MTSVPGGIDCGFTCAASVGGGTTVQLTAYAAVGYQFMGWTGEGCGSGVFTMRGAKATFLVLDLDGDRFISAADPVVGWL